MHYDDTVPLQAECLLQASVLRSGNLVYCAPTSGGKSLVAQVLMLRAIASTRKAALLVLPFVSLCEQQVRASAVVCKLVAVLYPACPSSSLAMPHLHCYAALVNGISAGQRDIRTAFCKTYVRLQVDSQMIFYC